MGNQLCFKIYHEATGDIIYQSEIRSALDSKLINFREEPITFDDTPKSSVKYVREANKEEL